MTEATAPVIFDAVPPLAAELSLPPASVAAVLALLDEGSTVPFIARYRKERTGGLDEVQIRAIEERREYLVELETRRAAILASIAEQGKLTPELEAAIKAVTGKSELEDLYAPYRPRRKTRASVAREKGLEPLALRIKSQSLEGNVLEEAAGYGLASADEALAGARDIVAEGIADAADVRAFVRREYAEHGGLVSEVVPGKGDEPTKFEQYYAFGESVKTIPSHRFLAIRRGEAEGVLRAHVAVDAAKVTAGIENMVGLVGESPWAEQLRLAVADAHKRLLAPSVENDVRAELKARSDQAAVDIFAGNLRNLMLAAPLGTASVIGVDPGLRTGCKCAAIDATGKFLGTVTIYITQGDAQLEKAKADFLDFVKKFAPRAIAVGNGTGGREAEAFVKKTLAEGLAASGDATASSPKPFVVQVNEAGASVYSASDLAREEFPELDLTIRGAISIARRLQDPLAELVKIEPKSIGVGQYQHDVHQPLLSKKLGDVVESCVNAIGVDLNTASASLLGYVAGIGKALAKKIVVHRDAAGAFSSRAQLLDVPGLGPKAFEQAAGFLRIPGATNPLDRSAVHPERYALVETIAKDAGVELPQLVGNQELVDKIDFSKYVTPEVGEPTLKDIAAELGKPGRDPRAEFSPPAFRDDVTSMEDLKPGMVLEGIVTNVTAFGAFVDIGVHNDGLVHVSQLSEQFVKDPAEVVKVGQKLTVRVLEVDKERKRIGLSARRSNAERQRAQQAEGGRGPQQRGDGGGGRGGRGPQPGGGGRGPQQGGGGRGPQQRGEGGGRGPQQGGGGRGPRNQGGRGDQPPFRGDGRQQQQGGPVDGGPIEGGQFGIGEFEARQFEGGAPAGTGPVEGGGGGRPSRQWQGRPGGDQAAPHDGGPNAGQVAEGQDGPNAGQAADAANHRGPRGPRGGNRGPRQGGWNQGGGNQGGGNQGAWNQGGNQGGGGRRDDRGPRQGGGNPGGGNWQGGGNPQGGRGNPPGGGSGQGGGRRDDRGPRRDDRGPRNDRGPRDDRGPEPAEGWGVSGFTNNPFAKLQGDKNKSK